MEGLEFGRVSTGVSGLDDVLGGGLPSGGIYLLQGQPGVGKTTIALQFLLEGASRGETVLYVALTETSREVHSVARSHGWSLEALHIWELPHPAKRGTKEEQTMFHPAEVELEEITRPILEEIDRVRPSRLVIDSLSELRLLSREPLRYRRQLLALKHFFVERSCTVLLIDTHGEHGASAGILETLIGGLILLDKRTPAYGPTRRRILVDKLRAVPFREGFHDFQIEAGGAVVYPRLVAAEHRDDNRRDLVSSGVQELDLLLGGGLERGTSTLVMGAAGTGKSSLATQYVSAEARRGGKAVVFAFEETLGSWLARSSALGFDVQPHLDAGAVRFVHIDPAELTPGQFSSMVSQSVERDQVRLLILDSLNGYLQSVPEEGFLMLHLHELLTYLAQRGASTILNMAQHGLLGPAMAAPLDISYLADSVILLRYFEAAGQVRQAISVLKKRSGAHERTIREFKLDRGGIRVGQPLSEFQGVLGGVPTYFGPAGPLMKGLGDG